MAVSMGQQESYRHGRIKFWGQEFGSRVVFVYWILFSLWNRTHSGGTERDGACGGHDEWVRIDYSHGALESLLGEWERKLNKDSKKKYCRATLEAPFRLRGKTSRGLWFPQQLLAAEVSDGRGCRTAEMPQSVISETAAHQRRGKNNTWVFKERERRWIV